MAGSGSSEVRTPIFSGKNYEFWRIRMTTIFKLHRLWKLVEKGISISDSKKKVEGGSEEEVDEKTTAVYMQDAKALGIIQTVVSDQIFPRIANAETAKIAWDLLCGEYHGGDQVRSVKLQNLRREFEYARMRDDETLSGYLTRLNDLINQMKTFGEILTNERLVQKVLISLSKPYDPICLVIENTKSLETVELQEVVTILKSQEQRFDLHTVDTIERAFAYLSVNSKGQQSKNNSKSQKNWNPKGKPWELKGKPQQNNYTPNHNFCSPQQTTQDAAKPQCKGMHHSGCSNHMNGSAELLVDIRTNICGKVQMPTGNLVDVVGIGSQVIETSVGKKYIREIMFLPGLKENLLSFGQMDEHGYHLLFGGGMCCIFDGPSLDKLVIKVKMKNNRCYPLSLMQNDQIALRANVTECTWIWHKTLGHLNLRSLKQLRDQSMVHGLPYLEEINGVCEGCQLGKQHRD
ncbi:PREDICTED: uncharacterized protein LOC107880314 [Prunus mume]|uniref:Uncharacterized protein LOC107880314 n=1 Tax=Prunus mume TaxID=102107 RepID=A0ABM1LI47_PRUMU|nr:PREDICTED: uncharacterized protein LOC107880314 [Prunus mume]